MTTSDAEVKYRCASTSFVITRADGQVIDLGVGSYWHRNPLRRLWWRMWGQPRFKRRAAAANRDAARAASTSRE